LFNTAAAADVDRSRQCAIIQSVGNGLAVVCHARRHGCDGTIRYKRLILDLRRTATLSNQDLIYNYKAELPGVGNRSSI